MDLACLPAAPLQRTYTKKREGTAVLTLSLRRPAFPDTGTTARVERYFAQIAQQWKNRWETILLPRACQALTDAQAEDRPFTPWRAELDYTVTLWRPPLLSLRLDAVETGPSPLPLRFCAGESWDCESGYPRTLRSFFPAKARRWRRELLTCLQEQAALQLASGESLLDPDCQQTMERTFDPDRFYLTEEGAVVFYPLGVLGPCAEGIPVFPVPLPGWQM